PDHRRGARGDRVLLAGARHVRGRGLAQARLPGDRRRLRARRPGVPADEPGHRRGLRRRRPTDPSLVSALPPITVPVEAVTHTGVFRRRRRAAWRRGPALVGLIIIGLWILVALTLPLWTPYGPLDPVGA